jgi:hypothetical protein
VLLAFLMAALPLGPYTSVARKWLALAERRQAYFDELTESGRWKHYFTPAELELEIRKVAALRDEWARLAGIPTDDDEYQQAAE